MNNYDLMHTPVYLYRGALVSSLGDDLDGAVAALANKPPALDWIATHMTGDASCAEVNIPCRLLRNKSLDDLQARSFSAIECVVKQALSEAGLHDDQKSKTGIFVGSSSFLVGASEQLYRRECETSAEPVALRDSQYGAIANYLSHVYGLKRGNYTFNTACTASANALLCASKMIRSGMMDHALVVGSELFNETTLLGFNNLELLTRSGMRPFDSRRNGLELGEACAAVVLSREPPANRNCMTLVAGANLCDAYSISAANPDGSTVALVMQRAIREAGVDTRAICSIKLHGTASLLNDDAESNGLKTCFTGQTLPSLTVLKPWLGHTLGACGLAELLLYCAALQQGFLPGSPGDFCADEKLDIHLPDRMTRDTRGYHMLNYFGFGGNNTSLIVHY